MERERRVEFIVGEFEESGIEFKEGRHDLIVYFSR